MDVAIFADTEELTKLLKRLETKAKKLKNTHRDFGHLLGSIVYADIIDHFSNEDGPNGKWAKWSKVYQAHMEKIGKGGNQILQDTGKLRNAFTPFQFRQVSGGYLWYNLMEYSGMHDRGEKGMPQRQFMWLSDEALQNIADQTLAFLVSGK